MWCECCDRECALRAHMLTAPCHARSLARCRPGAAGDCGSLGTWRAASGVRRKDHGRRLWRWLVIVKQTATPGDTMFASCNVHSQPRAETSDVFPQARCASWGVQRKAGRLLWSALWPHIRMRHSTGRECSLAHHRALLHLVTCVFGDVCRKKFRRSFTIRSRVE